MRASCRRWCDPMVCLIKDSNLVAGSGGAVWCCPLRAYSPTVRVASRTYAPDNWLPRGGEVRSASACGERRDRSRPSGRPAGAVPAIGSFFECGHYKHHLPPTATWAAKSARTVEDVCSRSLPALIGSALVMTRGTLGTDRRRLLPWSAAAPAKHQRPPEVPHVTDHPIAKDRRPCTPAIQGVRGMPNFEHQ